jgi:hypothetical protein
MTSRSPAKAPTIRAESKQAGHLARLLEAIAGLHRHATVLVLASAAELVAMLALEFVFFQRLSGGRLALDMRAFGYTPDEGLAWLTALGRRGSEIVIVWHYLTFDLLFPALLSVTFMSLILWTGRRLRGFAALPARMQGLLALGLVLPYALADYAQNAALVRLLSNFLNANPDSLALASALTVTSFALATVPLAVILAFLLAGRKAR